MLLLIVVACHKNQDEGAVFCQNPPPKFGFRVADAVTGADLLANGTIQERELKVMNEKAKNFSLRIFGNDTLKIVEIFVGAEIGVHQYTFSAGQRSATFPLNIVSGKCGAYIKDEVSTPAISRGTRGFYVLKF